MARRYARDKSGRFSSTGTTAKGARLGGKSSGPKMGGGKPGTSAPSGTIAKGGKGVRGSVARTSGAMGGYGKGTKVTGGGKGGNNAKFKSKVGTSKAKAAYKERSGQAREAANTVAKMKATGKAGKKDLAFFGKKASSAKASLTKLTNSRGAKKSGGKKRNG